MMMINKTTILDKKNYPVFGLIAALIVLLVAGGLWFLYSQKTKKVVGPEPTQPPMVLSKEALAIKKSLTKTDKKSGDLILEKNANFEIRYLIYNDQFMTFILKAPFEEEKGKAEAWFVKKGFSARDFCLLKVGFYASKDIEPNFSAQDSVPTGCPVPKTTATKTSAP